MPLWRCPHCGTPQAETSRCWVCRRSTTSCSTCGHFRRGVAGGLGLCGLDPRHAALRGDEMRACWTAPEATAVPPARFTAPAAGLPLPVVVGDTRRADGAVARARTFVPVDEPSPAPATSLAERGWSLWGDADA